MSAPAPTVVRVNGELTIQTAAEHLADLRTALAAPGPLEVNLGEVTELDTAGLQVLLAIRAETSRSGKEFRLANCSPTVLEVLEIAGVTTEAGTS